MSDGNQAAEDAPEALRIAAGEDRFGEFRGLGISVITFKLTSLDVPGALIIENTFQRRGGPPRHLHYEQDEWFFALEGEFVAEVGDKRFRLKPGDSLLAPRMVPHVWAYAGDDVGRMLISFFPAGDMEAFFREVTKANAMPPETPELWHAHGMKLLGPPLTLTEGDLQPG